MNIEIVKDQISIEKIKQLAEQTFGDMVKAVADIEKNIMAVGGELHADAEAALLAEGSKQENLWGFNIYPENFSIEQLEFTSLINIRPSLGNKSMEIKSLEIKEKIKEIVNHLIK